MKQTQHTHALLSKLDKGQRSKFKGAHQLFDIPYLSCLYHETSEGGSCISDGDCPCRCDRSSESPPRMWDRRESGSRSDVTPGGQAWPVGYTTKVWFYVKSEITVDIHVHVYGIHALR